MNSTFDPWDAGRQGADAIVNSLPWREFHKDPLALNPERLDDLSDVIMACIADVIASFIDAGSERDAVFEAGDLRKAILNELKGWT